ncbi:MAG: diacylglycerol/lipid kinase family protein [Candidatus Acidiferrales bacterium]
MRADTLILVNPAAGGGRALRAQPEIARFFSRSNHPVEFVRSQSTADLRRLAEEAATAGYRSIAALGGDGAFHHVVEATFGRDVILGFLPAGNGNDLAEALRIPKDPIAAASVFLKSRPRAIDVIRAKFSRDRAAIFLGAGGAGLDAEAAQMANTRFRRWPRVTRYLAGAFTAFARSKSLTAEIEMEGDLGRVTFSGNILMAAVANSPWYGSGFRIAPEAELDDGWMDIAVVREIPWTRLLEAIPILLRTGDLRWPEIQRHKARRMALRTNRPVLVHGDGEILGETPVEFEILPGAIRVIAPARHRHA